jgi:small-conductance mechanosensitive channel
MESGQPRPAAPVAIPAVGGAQASRTTTTRAIVPAVPIRIRLFTVLFAAFVAAACLTGGFALAQAPAEAPARPPMRIIIEVPDDAAGRAFVNDSVIPKLTPGAASSAPAAAPGPAEPQPANAPPQRAEASTGDLPMMMSSHLQQVRARAEELVRTAPMVPGAIADGWRTVRAMESSVDLVWLVAAVLLFAGGGMAAQRIAWWSARPLLAKVLDSPGDTVSQRLNTQALRIGFAIYVLTAFLIGSLGAFLLFPWPPLFRDLALVGLAAVLMTRLAVSLGRITLAPGARHLYFRLVPVSTPLAWFWHRRLLVTVWVFATGWALVSILRIVGIPPAARDVVAALALAALAITLITVIWQRHALTDEPPTSRLGTVLLTLAIIVGWLFAALRMDALFWTLAVAVTAPLVARLGGSIIATVAGRADAEERGDTRLITWVVVAERSFRSLVVIASAFILARAWGIDIGEIAMGETALTRTMRAMLRILIVLLVADLIWRLTRALIDGSLAGPVTSTHIDDSPEGRKRQRLHTLLPILRNFMLVIIMSVMVLMVLDALGIQIGPLLAGAGVIGIAVGFGAQTLVKDIISGIFYLLDDAFRVGEYIETKSYKGTVESFSLRSVKLRHHRGPLTTVPFGELGAVQNLSRDWVIDKVTIGVTYDTDLDLVKRIIKDVGKQLAADPEFAPSILEPLKMQGVEQMGDFAIQIRLKMMTKPGEQFVIRRRAYALIKKAFEANGIKFAFPTVTVSGGAGGDSMTAAAQRGFELTHPAPAPQGSPAE